MHGPCENEPARDGCYTNDCDHNLPLMHIMVKLLLNVNIYMKRLNKKAHTHEYTGFKWILFKLQNNIRCWANIQYPCK